MYSVTQGANYASIAAAIVVLAKLLDYDLVQSDVETIIAAVVILAAPIVSAINRYSKGDVSLAGFKG